MTSINTGMAAGVAQTAQQAQQVARQRDSERAQTQDSSSRIRDLFDSHLKLFEDSNRDSSSTRLRADDELPDPPTPQYESDGKRKSSGQDQAADEDTPVPVPGAAATEPDAPLYRHLDVQA